MPDTIQIMAELVAAYVSNNATPAAELPDLMKAVHGALTGTVSSVPEEPAPKLMPAVPVKKSVHHDFILSLETGEKFKTLRRHLSGLNLTPDEYRKKWGLPKDYPMIARGYSERRSALAKSLGLGRKPSEPVEAPAKVRKAQLKAAAAAELPTTALESVQEPAETTQAAIEARSNTTAPVEAEAPATAPESPVEPASGQQQAA